ncbi:MAG: biotin--[acetyl-CoA-carboxylase] ligase [Gammaproteobacteria bacterium]|nr:biotin--[acetyl-CoA-carboxylase] ligase [Gammaproteobacteria bacterium]
MDPRKLLEILSDARWHSADSLQAASGLDEQSLHDWLERFNDSGLEVRIGDENKISLAHRLCLLDRKGILQGLEPVFRESLVHFELPLIVDSTNTRAMEWLRGGNTGRALFLAEQQQNGRGRRGRTWISPMARNLTMSLVWPVTGVEQVQQGFSLVVALSLVESMRSLGLKGSELLRVKWPNDVWLGEAKLAGILLELHSALADSHHVVIGVGVNVQLPDRVLTDIDQPASDLYSQGNRQLDRNPLVVSILTHLERNLESLRVTGFEAFRQQWHELDIYRNRQVEVVGHGPRVTGVVRGVSASGALILETRDGERTFCGGEIAPTVRSLHQPATSVESVTSMEKEA